MSADTQTPEYLRHVISVNLGTVFSKTNTTCASFARCLDIPTATLDGYAKGARLPPVSLLVKIKDFYQPAFGEFNIDKFLTDEF